jgi:chaperonin GroEL
VESLKDLKLEQEDAQIGVNIVRKALTEPMKKIVENAGKDGSVVVETVRQKQAEASNKHIGFNVLTEEYGDMVELGVIDPAKVTRGALENAASIAAMILTTEALVTDIPEPEGAAPAMPQGGGMY